MSGIRTSTQALVVAASALAMGAVAAQAGGLSVHEQSTSAQGSSWAGAAAGYDLSSAFWNPAAFGIAGRGFTTESHAALLIPDATLSGTASVGPQLNGSTDIGNIALIPASYAAYRLNQDLVLGLSINSPFGLATKPDDLFWAGRAIGQTSKLFSVNATPTLAYQIAPGLHVAAGVQLEYMKLTYKFAASQAAGTLSPTAIAEIDDDLGLGFTAGVLWQPSKRTSIGLGYRSSITHDLDGTIAAAGVLPSRNISAEFKTPETVTLSIRQEVAPKTRLLGTIEWTNWSRFGVIPIEGSAGLGPGGGLAALKGNWHDGWLYSVGLEYDVNQKLTVRTGVAFEKSPIQNATERLIQVPDSDRWWVSGGATYKWSEKITFDFAYTHIFFDDAPFQRQNLAETVTLTGNADQSADIISFSMKTKW